jgi:TPR repeat protein
MYRLCGSGHPGACQRVSADLSDAEWRPRSELDWERFRAAFAQGCTAGVFSACGTLARLHVEGRFADSSEEVAVPLYEFACARAGASACHELGELHAAAGREQPAFEAWVHGCMELGHRPSCVDGAAWLQAQGAEPERVAPWLGAACELGETSACPPDSP